MIVLRRYMEKLEHQVFICNKVTINKIKKEMKEK